MKRLALAVAAVAAAAGPPESVWAAVGVGILVRALTLKTWRRAALPAIPVVLFAALLALLEYAAQQEVSMLGLRTLAVFLLSTAAFHGISGARWALGSPPESLRQRMALYGLFVTHFTRILGAEARRVLLANRLAAPRRWGPGWFGSLTHALAGIFLRSLARAERFYAAQWLRGLGQ